MKKLPFLRRPPRPWERLVRSFDEEDQKAAQKAALQDARTAMWLRLAAPTGETDAGPSREACQEKIDAAMETGVRFPAADLDAAWHSKRFGEGAGSIGSQSYSDEDAERQRRAYAEFIQKYGDEAAQDMLSTMLAWKEAIHVIAGPYDGLFELTPEMCNEEEWEQTQKKLRYQPRRVNPKNALRHIWKLDIFVRCLKGKLSTEQASWVYDQMMNAENHMRRDTGRIADMIAPSLRRVSSLEEFIAQYAKQLNE